MLPTTSTYFNTLLGERVGVRVLGFPAAPFLSGPVPPEPFLPEFTDPFKRLNRDRSNFAPFPFEGVSKMVSRRLSFPFRSRCSRILMEAALWTSIVLGVALGLANAAASFLLYRVARNKPQGAFMAIVFGGMVARMFAVLALLALAIVFLPVSRVAFIGAFFATFAVAMTAEIILLQRWAQPPASSSTESPPLPNGG